MADTFHIGQRVAFVYDGDDLGHGTVFHVDWTILFVEMDDGSFEHESAEFFLSLDEDDREPQYIAELTAIAILSIN